MRFASTKLCRSDLSKRTARPTLMKGILRCHTQPYRVDTETAKNCAASWIPTNPFAVSGGTSKDSSSPYLLRRCRLAGFGSFPPVGPSVGSVSGRRDVSANAAGCQADCVSTCWFRVSFSHSGKDKPDTWRGACCRDDAVFSRAPNWSGRAFMLLRGLCKSASFGFFLVVMVCVLA